MTTIQTVIAHLAAVEQGDWNEALKYIADDYKVVGAVPFPISLFVKLGKKDALTMHKARKAALPDFKFNQVVEEEGPDWVKIRVNLTGTQTGTIDYRGILRGIPVIAPTNKFVKLNPEWFTYFVRGGQIYKVVMDIPKNAGVKGLVKAVS